MSIKLTNLTKRYGDLVVVNNVSVDVYDGELFVLLGSSGSGKSTVLRIIAGLTPLDYGRVELNGRDVTELPSQKRGTGFVFQNYSIFRHMTAAENIEFGLRIRQVPPQERARRSEELLELVGLTGLGGRYPDQLSGGQRQRVALARALAYQPDVLLLDEPFGALDVKIRAQLREGLKEIQRHLGVTTILVTHDQEEAFELGDRIGVMDRGALVEVGCPEDLYHRPHSEYAATFIGGGNVLVGRVTGGQIQLGPAVLPFPANAPKHDEGARVRVLFRPETVALSSSPFSLESRVHLLASGKVVERIFAGSQQRILLEIDGLQGVRPINPAPVYGRLTTQVEVLQLSTADTPGGNLHEDLWIGIRNYHVLDPTGLKVLICHDGSPGAEAAAQLGGSLVLAARGPATLLAVARDADRQAGARLALEEAARRYFSDAVFLDQKVRQGAPGEEILLEAQEGSYEVAVLGKSSSLSPSSGAGATARYILARAELPLLLVGSVRTGFKKILICTAAGEPGKSDVLFGARIARQTKAEVTVFHVLRPYAEPREVERVERHLSQSLASLHALDIQGTCKIEQRQHPLEAILTESQSGGYDLIVIGRPAPHISQQLFWTDVATQIVHKANSPVLVVPMAE